MNALAGPWLELAVRWVHIITGIAWIGASFYFNWLLNRLQPAADGDPRVRGELWAIHAGGFFRVQKHTPSAAPLPEPLHWFKWEAYSTWLSGFVLLVLVYYLRADAFMLGRTGISPGAAIAIGIGTLIGAWVVYDLLWRALARRPWLASGISCALLAALAWGLSQVLSGRAAYIHVGAALGTLMAANVLMVIMPAQRQLVAATLSGEAADPALAASAQLRSLHNNYMTLPVLFTMISNHYPGSYANEHGWIILLVLFIAGVLARHYFNVRQRTGNLRPAWMLVAAAAILVVLAILSAPAARVAGGSERVTFAQARAIIDRHCVSCHAEHPSNAAFAQINKGVHLETSEQIRMHAERIREQAVLTEAMPLGNLSGMTGKERELLGQWIAQGAQSE